MRNRALRTAGRHRFIPSSRHSMSWDRSTAGELPDASSRSAETFWLSTRARFIPCCSKLEHEGSIASEWGASENNRRARFYRLTGAGRKQLQAETREWEQTAAIIARFFKVKAEDLV
jgi:DNA-binding PadR family transcriptional regulator